MSGLQRSWTVPVALAAILGAAVALRFAGLGTNPGGLYTDEATEAVSALRLLHDPGYHPIFFPGGGGREALFAYLVAGAFALFGETTLVLRGTAAAIGVGGVVAIWWLGRRFGTVAALVSAAWAAGALWLVCISRDGMRNTLVPLFGALAFVALLAWERRADRRSAVVAGATVALAALYTYQPLKLLPLLAILWLAWLRRVDAGTWSRMRPTLIPATLAFAVVAAPMLVVAVTDPVAYFGRAVGVTPLNPADAVNPLDHLLRTLGMFAFTGDPNPRHDVAALPMLGWPAALVALVGAARIWRRRHDPAHALMGIALPVFLLPPLVATEGGAPHFLRSLGLAAPVAVLVGLGAAELVRLARRRGGGRLAAVAATAVAIGLLALAAGSASAYFARPVAERYTAYRYELVAIAGAAGPRDAVLLDDYDASVVLFLDADHPPTIAAPGKALPDPGAYRQVLAVSRDALVAALGPGPAAAARVIARDAAGNPTAWVVAP